MRARFVNGSFKVEKYVGTRICGLIKMGRDHILATSEWIGNKCEWLYDDGHDLIQGKLLST